MNGFIQIDEYLTRKFNENCDDYDKFILEYVHGMYGSSLGRYKKFAIKNCHDVARDRVKDGFEKDCDVFKERAERFNIPRPEYFSEIVLDIYFRRLEKLEVFARHKYTSMMAKYELHEGDVDKYTLLKWLTGSDL